MLQLNNFTGYFAKIKKIPKFVPLILMGIGLLLVLFGNSVRAAPAEKSVKTDYEGYVRGLETSLRKNIIKLNSVKDCTVMITVSSYEDNKYLENANVSSTVGDKSTQNSSQHEYLVIKNGGDDSVVVQSRRVPTIGGVLIVYDGSTDMSTKKNIIEAASTVLNIQSNKVCVVSTSK